MVVTWAYNAGTNTATASGAGTTNFAALVAADTAGGWGVFTADATGTQITCSAKIIIGDGTNACAFTDTGKQIFLNYTTTTNFERLFDIKATSSVTLGTLVDAATYQTKSGCSIQVKASASNYAVEVFYTSASTASMIFYDCKFYSTNAQETNLHTASGAGTVYNCLLDGVALRGDTGSWTVHRINIRMTNGAGVYALNRMTSGTFNDIFVSDSDYGVYTQLAHSLTLKNCIFRSCSWKAIRCYQLSTNKYMINCDFDVWNFNWGTGNTAYIMRQYEFDLAVTNSSCTPLDTATYNTAVTLTKGATTINLTTDASGNITTQTLTYGYYDQTHGDTIQDNGNWTLTITADGYIPYTTACPITEKTKLHISLHPQLTGNAAATDVANGKTFYSDDADTQLTGTYTSPALTGNATVADVRRGKTFYSTDAETKLTGTLRRGRGFVWSSNSSGVSPLEESLLLLTANCLSDKEKK